jgi:glutamyl-tRNA reductase
MANWFKALSLSHKTAPLAIREQVALNEGEIKTLSLKLKELFELQELLIVSTCNRTELYYSADAQSAEIDLSQELIKLLCIEKGLLDASQYLPYFQVMNDAETATRHLFEVATGLHSKVVGDLQIPNQVKQAYQWSADVNCAGPFLHRLLHTVFFTNKRVAQETGFRDGAASVSYATVELIEELTRNLAQPKVLVVGLGEIGADVVKNLADKEFAQITLTNRTRAKAETLATNRSLPGQSIRIADFADLETELRQADVVVSSVRLDQPLITKTLLTGLNRLQFQYFIDLSVPRSIEPEVEEVPGVLLYAIDDIRTKSEEALQRRLASIPQVQALIDEALVGFADWSREMVVSPTIQKFKNALEQIRKDELSRHLKNLTAEEADKLDKITAGLIQKIIKFPVLNLKAACKRGDADQLADVLSELFDLEKQAQESR